MVKVKIGSVVLAAALLAGCMIGICGCSESRQTQAGESLLAEVQKAQKLYEKCLAHLANPLYRAAEDYSPLQSCLEDDTNIVIAQPGQLHPEVLPTLKRIEDRLSAALVAKECADAGPEDKAIAHVTLSKAYALRGYCELLPTERAYDQLSRQRDETEHTLRSLSSDADLLLYYRSLSLAKVDDLVALLDQGGKQQTRVESRIKDIEERLAAMAAEKKTQAGVYEKRSAEARSLGLESTVGSAKAGMEKLDQALRLRAEANQAELLIAQVEYEADSLAEERKSLELDLVASKAKIAAADGALADRKAIAEANGINAEQISGEIQSLQSKLTESLEAMQGTCGQLSTALAKATNAYELALGQIGKVPADRDGSIAVREADVLMSLADAQARAIGELDANKKLADRASRVWSKLGRGQIPSGIGRIQQILPDPASSRSDAEAKYGKAAQLYQKAMGGADRNLRWAYEGQLAAPYVRLYMLNGDPAALDAAREALAKALEGREFSPHLRSMAELQEALVTE